MKKFFLLKATENRLHLRCYCEIPKNPAPKQLEIMLTPKFLPKGWIRREKHQNEWFLKIDKDSRQPLVVYLSNLDHENPSPKISILNIFKLFFYIW